MMKDEATQEDKQAYVQRSQPFSVSTVGFRPSRLQLQHKSPDRGKALKSTLKLMLNLGFFVSSCSIFHKM